MTHIIRQYCISRFSLFLVLFFPVLCMADFEFSPGEPDNGRHPNVGWVAAFDATGARLPAYCSGTLIAPKVFLTAAHCTKSIYDDPINDPKNSGLRVYVGFSDDFIPEGGAISDFVDPGLVFEAARVVTNPAYDGNWQSRQPDRLDLGIVLLKKSPKLSFAKLPYVGELRDLNKAGQLRNAGFTIVGYGASEATIPAELYGSPWYFFQAGMIRRVGTATFNALHPSYLLLSINIAAGNGGSCYGDSGGPVILNSNGKMMAITATGDLMCRASAAPVRLDTREARKFINEFLN